MKASSPSMHLRVDEKRRQTMIESTAFVFGWNQPRVGRENHCVELFTTTVNYFEKQKKAGKIEICEPVFMRAHGGDMNGFFYVRCTQKVHVDTILADEEWNDIVLRANHCLEQVGVINCYVGTNIQEVISRWTKQIPR
jgi:hypothetical protein